jgi:hypothetical protein
MNIYLTILRWFSVPLILWALIYFNRIRIIQWICARRIAHFEYTAAIDILEEARFLHYINYLDEKKIRERLGLTMEDIRPAFTDPKPDLKRHTKELLKFFSSRKG